MNNIKTLFLLVTLTLVLVWAGGALGGKQGMTIALIFALGINFISYWFSDKIVLRMYRAKQVTEAEAPDLYSIVRSLVQKAGMPMPKVYMMDQEQPNAFATGRNPTHAAVAVTTGIMRILTREELQGVIGHELSHIKNRDILISTIAATIAGAISYLAQMAQWAMIFGGHRGDDDKGGSPIAAFVMMIVGPIAAMIIQMAISRSREYAADSGGAEIAGNPRYLAGALRKLHMASQKIPMHANPATSHMFIVNPFSGGGIVKLFSTHPPIEERIARLESMSH
ncbi:MAG TPA: zinc metalloprotease HtpX [Thermodesulfovibrionales bacterium]|jgi:heat shock protein HtpX|nr:zinc metalloprotease HtpX [Thermodesulfovibrionales bacterium]